VHLFGHPVDVDPLLEVAEKHGLYVIEDAAQAHGAQYKGTRVGAFGHVSCFSFYADKLLTTVEGGMALTNNAELADTMRSLRSFGMTRREKFQHPVLGFNYKMSDLHAAIGLVQLQKLGYYIEKRRSNIRFLTEQLTHTNLRLPLELDYAFNVYYTCHILAKTGKAKIVEHLERQEIETRPLLSFIPDQPPYQQERYSLKELQVARTAHQQGFYVSNSPLLTDDELDFMASAIIEATRGLRE
jgi:perosamine synthetase